MSKEIKPEIKLKKLMKQILTQRLNINIDTFYKRIHQSDQIDDEVVD